MSVSDKLREALFDSIEYVANHIKLYTRKPDIDFTRRRLLDAPTTLTAIICMGTSTLEYELTKGIKGPKIPSASAFCQQRAKIVPDALRQVLLRFNLYLNDFVFADNTQVHLIAVDGSEIVMQKNSSDKETYNDAHNFKLGYNSAHLCALYDLNRKIYLDGIIVPAPKKDEPFAFRQLIDRIKDDNCIIVADRNFESYNNFAHCIKRNIGFVIRIKDLSAKRFLKVDDLPDTLDEEVEVILTRKRTKAAKKMPGYRFISSKMKFDFIDKHHPYYTLPLRIVRFAITTEKGDTVFENLATNLPVDKFSPEALKNIYAARWGIETSFRDLKHSIGLAKPHSASLSGVAQEIFGRMVLYNFCSVMASLAQHLVHKDKNSKYRYVINYANAVRICREILWPRAGPSDRFLERIAKSVSPVRPYRSHPRHKRLNSTASFAYRG